MCVFVLLCVAESRRPVKDCFLAVLSSHGEEGCVFGADGKPVWLSRIYRCLDNDCMEKKAKLFLIQVNTHTEVFTSSSRVQSQFRRTDSLLLCKFSHVKTGSGSQPAGPDPN